MGKKKAVANALIYFGAVLAVFAVIAPSTGANATEIHDVHALQNFDFSAAIARLGAECYTLYPNALYTPEDFAAGSVRAPETLDNGSFRYGTYRFELTLPPGQVYGLSGLSTSYAQALWIDGTLYSEVGKPGDSAETTTHKTASYTVYFTPKGPRTEIIIQRANFAHARPDFSYYLYLAEQPLITARILRAYLRDSLVVGCMVMSALFFFGIFLFLKVHIHFLWFSLACLLISIRTLIVDNKLIMTLFPDLRWEASHLLEYLSTVGFLIFLFAYINKMFHRRYARPVNGIGLTVASLYGALVMFTPSVLHTGLLPYMQYFVVFYAVTTLCLLLRDILSNPENRRQEHLLIFLGTVAYIVLASMDVARYKLGYYDDFNLNQTGMMVFVLANTLALALSFTRMETELNAVKQSELELEETNRMLARLNRVKSDFLSNISHEMRTPLTIMGSYAGLTLRQLRKNAVNARTEKNLDVIQREAVRLGALVEQLKDVALEKERQLSLRDEEARSLLQRAADFCLPICRKNGNRIVIHTHPEQFTLRINGDAIFQVLFNLISNANRHTRGGVISLSAETDGASVYIGVRDNGDGVEPRFLASVFQRGVSGDGGTGLGLAICQEIVEEHGGAISFDSAPGMGTSVGFTLPLKREESRV